MSITTVPTTSLWYGWCQRNLPPFIWEQFQNDEERLNTLLNSWESVFYTMHTSLADLVRQLDVDTADPQFLYLLGRQLGVEEIQDLTNSQTNLITDLTYANGAKQSGGYIIFPKGYLWSQVYTDLWSLKINTNYIVTFEYYASEDNPNTALRADLGTSALPQQQFAGVNRPTTSWKSANYTINSSNSLMTNCRFRMFAHKKVGPDWGMNQADIYVQNLKFVEEDAWADQVNKQRVSIKFALFRYLMKGTKDSIKNYLYERDLNADVIEKWFSTTPDASIIWPSSDQDIPQDLVTYGSAIWGDMAGPFFHLDTPYNLEDDIVNDIPSVSGSTDFDDLSGNSSWIHHIHHNDFGYRYLITATDKQMYYKIPSTTDPGSFKLPETWYQFTGSWGVDGDADDITSLGTRLFVHTTTDNLSVVDRKVENLELGGQVYPFFSVDGNSTRFYKIFDFKTKLFLDRSPTGVTPWMEIRDSTTFQILSNNIPKPADFTGYVREFEYFGTDTAGNKYWLVGSTTRKFIIIKISTENTATILGDVVYDLPITATAQPRWNIYATKEWQITVLEDLYDSVTTNHQLIFHYLQLEPVTGNVDTSLDIVDSFDTFNIFQRLRYKDIILIPGGANYVLVFDLATRRYYRYLLENSGGGTVRTLRFFWLDKLYAVGRDNTATNNSKIWHILGFNAYSNSQLYKSHHIDLAVRVSTLLTIPISELATWIDENIIWVKPAHVIMDSTKLILTPDNPDGTENSLAERMFPSDVLCQAPNIGFVQPPSSDGGSVYTLEIYAHYDGLHPYKRDSAPVVLLNAANGLNNQPLLRYQGNIYTFSGSTPASAFDNLAYHNIPIIE